MELIVRASSSIMMMACFRYRASCRLLWLVVIAFYISVACSAFHDCVQSSSSTLRQRRRRFLSVDHKASGKDPSSSCSGGLCLGMRNGPHEGGSAAYPVQTKNGGLTQVWSTMTVPALPKNDTDITYYIWTDIFFGDGGSYGRMNQFVPQLILGHALSGSTGPPHYDPIWNWHTTWMFGAHYFFEVYNVTTKKRQGKAAYGDLFPAYPGETLYTSFIATENGEGHITWTLIMGALSDSSRMSVLEVPAPYMGLGRHWPEPTTSWNEANYTNMCINACWELYGAVDRSHTPYSGSLYDLGIEQPEPFAFPWVTEWDEDEGNGRTCATSKIEESHSPTMQHVLWWIDV